MVTLNVLGMTLATSQAANTPSVGSGWRRPETWHFARDLSAVALTPHEIGRASHFFPIVFSKQITGWRAFAVFCLDNGKNRFVHPISGDWLAGYAPIFLRSAPFMLHTGAENALQFWPGLGPLPMGEELEPFLVNGQPNPKLVEILSVLKTAHQSMMQIDDALTQLEACGGLVKWVVEDAPEPNVKLMGNDAWVLAPGCLTEMNDDLLLTLHHQKALGWLYAHQQSFTNVRRLLLPVEPDVDFDNLENYSFTPRSSSLHQVAAEKFLNEMFRDETLETQFSNKPTD